MSENEEVKNTMCELTEEEVKETSGGAGGYGNVQYVCVCGKSCLTEVDWKIHLQQSKHKSGKVYYQKAAGKGHRGNLIGTATVTFKGKSFTITYPNGNTTRHYW